MIVSRIQKFFELCVGHRVLIHIERGDMHLVLVIATRGVFPGILHIYARIVEALDLNAVELEQVVCCWNEEHSLGRGTGGR